MADASLLLLSRFLGIDNDGWIQSGFAVVVVACCFFVVLEHHQANVVRTDLIQIYPLLNAIGIFDSRSVGVRPIDRTSSSGLSGLI